MPLYPSGTVTVDTTFGFAEDTPHVSTDSGAFVLAVRNDAGTALAADGDYIPFTTDSSGALRVAASVAINYAYPEDSPHTTGNIGSFVLAVRNDSGIPLAADGDYIPFTTNAAGELRVTTAGGTPTGRDDTDNQAPVATGLNTVVSRAYVFDGANWDRWTGAITDGGGSLTVDGTVEIGATSLAALESITVQNGSGGAAVNIQDGGNSITVDGTVSVSGTVTTADIKVEDTAHTTGDSGAFVLAVRNDAGTPLAADGDYIPFTTDSAGHLRVTVSQPIAVTDGGGSLTVDGTVEIGATSLAALESITVQNGSGAAAVNIQDGGNSITVDGTVSISGTVDTELPTAVALADAMANPTVPQVGAHSMVFNGTTWDRVNGRPSNTDAQASDGEGGVEVIGRNYTYNGTTWDRVRSAGSIGAIQVGGTAAHDSAVAGNPIITGSRAQDDNTTITSVTAGDAVFNLADLKGVQFIKEQRPQLLGIYYGIFGPSQLTNAADGATAGRMWLVNTSATVAAAIRYISFEAVLASTTAMLTFPRITVERMTFTGTPTGATITPGLRASTDATNTATIRTASTGMTISAGAGLHNFIPPLSLTGVGTISIPEQKYSLSDHADGRVILGQNQGVVIRQADGGSANDNRRFFISIAWEEYTI